MTTLEIVGVILYCLTGIAIASLVVEMNRKEDNARSRKASIAIVAIAFGLLWPISLAGIIGAAIGRAINNYARESKKKS